MNHKLQWWAIIVVIATIGGLFQDIIKPTTESILNNLSKKEINDVSLFKSDTTFNVLFLSLTPDQNCVNQERNFDNIIKRHYEELKEKENLQFNIEYSDKYKCPNSIKTTHRIGQENKASLVIWGYYDENCSGILKLRIRYTFVSKLTQLDEENGDTNFAIVRDLDQLRNGLLFEDIDYVLMKNLATHQFNKMNYSNCIKILEKLNKNECDLEVLSLKSICHMELSNLEESMNANDFALSCLIGELKSYQENLQLRNHNYEAFLSNWQNANRVSAFLSLAKKNKLFVQSTEIDDEISNQIMDVLNTIEENNVLEKENLIRLGREKNWL